MLTTRDERFFASEIIREALFTSFKVLGMYVCMYVCIVYAYMYVQYMYVWSSFTFTIINFLEDYYYNVFKTLNICMYVYIDVCMYHLQ